MKKNNLIIKQYGVLLERLTESKLELLRNWRNDPKISQFMDFREHITPEMQVNWFQKINNENNYYFIVQYQGKDIGMVNLKDIDYKKKCAEPGIFIYDDEYLNSDVGIRVQIANIDFGFEILELDYLFGYVMSNNKRAVRFSKALGFTLNEGEENKLKQKYTLTRENFEIAKKKFIDYLSK